MSATGFHPEPSAKAPWTRTIVLTAAYAGHDAAKAAPVRRARIKRFTAKLRQRSLQDQQATSRVAGRPSPGVLKLAAEFSKPLGTSRGFSSSNAPPLYLFQRARIFCSYDRSNLFFLHRPQSDFTVMKCCHNHPSTPEILNRSRPLMGWSGRADQRAQFRIDLRSASKRAGCPTPVSTEAGSMPPYERLGPDDHDGLEDRWKPSIQHDQEQTIPIRELHATAHSPLQHDHLMSECRVLCRTSVQRDVLSKLRTT